MSDYDDPGWVPAIKQLIPFAVLFKNVRKPAWRNALLNVRAVHVAFVAAPFLYPYVLPFIIAEPGRSNGAFLTGIAGLSAGSLVLQVWVRGRPLDASSEDRLVQTYRTNYFLSVAAAEPPLLVGFVLTIVTGNYGPYLVGMAATLFGFLLAAPTRRDIARRQQEIAAQGATLSLGAALIQHPARNWRRRRLRDPGVS